MKFDTRKKPICTAHIRSCRAMQQRQMTKGKSDLEKGLLSAHPQHTKLNVIHSGQDIFVT
uniref:Uncharacterized protein n=1 Tax=Anguilla anguilla TaxID=7936 RepID=A0A0E9WD47_ANGAN